MNLYWKIYAEDFVNNKVVDMIFFVEDDYFIDSKLGKEICETYNIELEDGRQNYNSCCDVAQSVIKKILNLDDLFYKKAKSDSHFYRFAEETIFFHRNGYYFYDEQTVMYGIPVDTSKINNVNFEIEKFNAKLIKDGLSEQFLVKEILT